MIQHNNSNLVWLQWHLTMTVYILMYFRMKMYMCVYTVTMYYSTVQKDDLKLWYILQILQLPVKIYSYSLVKSYHFVMHYPEAIRGEEKQCLSQDYYCSLYAYSNECRIHSSFIRCYIQNTSKSITTKSSIIFISYRINGGSKYVPY